VYVLFGNPCSHRPAYYSDPYVRTLGTQVDYSIFTLRLLRRKIKNMRLFATPCLSIPTLVKTRRLNVSCEFSAEEFY